MIDILSRSIEKRRDPESGFTLIELLVVIVILGILAAVVVFAVGGVGDKGKAAAQKTDLDTVRTAEEAYCANNGTYATEDELVAAGLLSEKSTQTDVVLNSGGTCGTSTGAKSQFMLVPQNPTEDGLIVGVGSNSTTADFGTSTATGSAVSPSPVLPAAGAGIKSSFGMSPTNTNIFENLVRMTPDFQVEPWLAESYERIANNRADAPYSAASATFRFHLRKGVKFHNGTEMTRADVVYSINNRAPAGLKLGGASAAFAAPPFDTDVYAVDITPTATNERLIEQLVHPQNVPIIANGTVPQNGTAAPTPVGTGPFKLASYTALNQLVLVRHDTYWGAKAKLKNLTFKFDQQDFVAREAALRAGQIDMMFDLPKDSFPGVGSTSGLAAVASPPGFNEVMWFNSHRPAVGGIYPPMSDPTTGLLVRKAVAASIDKAGIVNATWPAGTSVPSAKTFLPAAVLGSGASAITGTTFSQSTAATLLDQAGWICPGGIGTTCAAPGATRTKAGVGALNVGLIDGYPPIALRGLAASRVRDSLQAVGIGVTLTSDATAGTVYLPSLDTGTNDMYMERISQNDANAATPPLFFFDCAGGNTGPYVAPGCPTSAFGGTGNGNGYPRWTAPGAAFESQIAQAFTATDIEVSRQKTGAALHEALDNYVAGYHLTGEPSLFGMKSEVQGFVLQGSLRHVRWATVYRLA